MMRRSGALAITILVSAVSSALAAPAPRPLDLTVDATEAPRGIFHSHLTVPAAPGPLTLAYPKWIQGEHAPTGPVMQVAGLTVSAQGKTLAWRRDPIERFLVQVDVPAGAGAVEVELDYLSPPEGFGAGYGKTPNATQHLAVVDWHDLLVYPLEKNVDQIPVRARLRLPAGWQIATALAVESGAEPNARQDGTVTFAPTTLYNLIDGPVLAGDLFRTIEIGPAESMSLAADRRSSLAMPEARIAAYRRLPGEAQALFGGRHYRRYHWLVALGDTLDNNGLEHHESSDNRGTTGMFTDESELVRWATLLPHEYVHAWNGKYRRPAGLAVHDWQEPLRTDLLWIYEGLTRYLGDFVLTGRSGLWTAEQSREYIAYLAANQDHNRPGRRWRPLVDTAVSVPILGGLPQPWTAYRRAFDFYDESALIWLEADTILRQRSGGTKSLDDFCKAFYGETGPPAIVPYTVDDVYAALNKIVPYDWHAFFATRVEAVAPRAPVGGLENAGWKLDYDDRPNTYQAAREKSLKIVDATFTLGLWLKEDGTIADIVVSGPAWEAGFGPGMKITAVNGRTWSRDVLNEEIAAAVHSKAPLEMTAAQGEDVRTFRVDYHGGPRFPHLVRDAARADLLAAILAPRAPGTSAPE
ncbi:MAG TPA: M61 family peptidase [Thermoanaerobaculia bacterium]|nr:M61 family peptidase [Thermoanaerobaculia bacterium]